MKVYRPSSSSRVDQAGKVATAGSLIYSTASAAPAIAGMVATWRRYHHEGHAGPLTLTPARWL